MFTKIPIITDMGKTLLLRAVGGEQFTFTKFQVGNGTLSDNETPEAAIALKSTVLDDIGISQAQGTEEEGYIQLSGAFDNQTGVEADFLWTELGLIAEDEQGNEYLYAYGYDNERAEVIRAGSSSVIVEQTISIIIAIGDTENITAQVLPNATYAGKQEFDAHTSDTRNPHHVTAEQTGAAAEHHSHSASDITSGVLGVARGGTGASSYERLAQNIGMNFKMGYFVGNGALRRDISLGFQPSRVFLIPLQADKYQTPINASYQVENDYVTIRQSQEFGLTFAPGENYYRALDGVFYRTCSADALFNQGHGGAAVTSTGFAVGYYNGMETKVNVNGIGYLYIALMPA